MGSLGSSCIVATSPSHESFLGGLELPARLVRDVLRDGLPHPVDTMLTFSTGASVCLMIFPLSSAGIIGVLPSRLLRDTLR